MARAFALLLAGLMLAAATAPAAASTDAPPGATATKPYPAPELAGITHWINSPPLTLEKLRGKVVLVDFWAYSCVNCVRTLPYLSQWYATYHKDGLEIIGVHAPEFDFEKDQANVERAVRKWHIPYPVAMDNQLATWNHFANQYWPAHYLIDKDGKVVYTHAGEGEYDVTENRIRALLGMKATRGKDSPPSFSEEQTPETYLGSTRQLHFDGALPTASNRLTRYAYPAELPLHHWALQGDWVIGPEAVEAGPGGAKLKLHFTSHKVYLVLGSKTGSAVSATLTLNGKPPANAAGKDAPEGKLRVDHHALYELVAQPGMQEGELELSAGQGLMAYAFTFGE